MLFYDCAHCVSKIIVLIIVNEHLQHFHWFVKMVLYMSGKRLSYIHNLVEK